MKAMMLWRLQYHREDALANEKTAVDAPGGASNPKNRFNAFFRKNSGANFGNIPPARTVPPASPSE
jgi:hypothetical protein